MAKVTAFPALSHVTTVSSGSSYTAYTTTSTSNGPPKVPGSPGCISPDSTTMVGPSGFEASLYDEFMSNKRTYVQPPAVLPQQAQTQQPQPQTYLLPQTTVLTSSLPASKPTNEDYTRFFILGFSLQGQSLLICFLGITCKTSHLCLIISSLNFK